MTTTLQPPPVSPAPATQAPVSLAPFRAPPRVSAAGFWIGGLLTAAAIIGAVCWVIVAYFDYQHRIDSYPRMAIPSTATVQITDTGTRVVFYESNRGTSAPVMTDLGLTVTSPSGATVPVTSYGGDLRYDVPGHHARIGHGVAQFHADEIGPYQIRSAPAAGVTGTLAIGTDFVWDIVPQVIGVGALFLLGGGAGVALLIVTGVRRGNARRSQPA